jgi:hypothetical protein
MTRIDPKALGEIESLMQERQKYEKWIASLGERRSITPTHVFQRVLADYQDRMRTVSADLAGRATEVEGSMHFLRDRLTQVQQEEETTADERSEAELRAAVGEYSPDKWEEIRRIADENISRLSALRMELSGELSHLGSILAIASPKQGAELAGAAESGAGDGGAASPGRVTDSGRARDYVETSVQPTTRAVSPIAAAAQRPVKEDTFDELAFLSSVVESEISHLSMDPADLPIVRGTQDGAADRAVRAAPPSSASSAASKIGRSDTPMISESIHSASDENEAVSRMGDEPARAAFDRKLSGSVPAYLKDVPKEASKSLKCQECGTMNYPTEWYCERCGGELAAL